jgi:hypothetical protein
MPDLTKDLPEDVFGVGDYFDKFRHPYIGVDGVMSPPNAQITLSSLMEQPFK